MYIRVQVTVKAKKESFEKTSENSFSVAVKQPAEQNLANDRVLELIGKHFKVSPKKIRIISGHHTRGKILSIPD